MASCRPYARWFRPLLAAGCFLPLVQACGRSDLDDQLYGVGVTDEAGSPATGVAGTRSGTGGASSTGGSVTTGGTRSGTAGTGIVTGGTGVTTGGTGIVSGGAVSTGGSVITAGTTSVAGAAGAPPGQPMTCGTQVCDSDTQYCCANFGLSCIANGKPCGGATLGCTTNADCDGNGICCISITGDASAASSCKAQCDFMGGGRDRQLCEVDADCRMPFRFCTPTVFGVNICTRRM